MAAESINLRDAQPGDVDALARLHVQAFRETHGGGPDIAVRARQWQAKFDKGILTFCLVLEAENGLLVGFASGEQTGTTSNHFAGVLDKIYVLRKYHRQGLGRRLLCASAERFLDDGVRSMLLFGDARSPSNGFYEAMGGERLLSDAGEFHGSYGWRDLNGLVLKCTK